MTNLKAYYAGRNSVWNGESAETDLTGELLVNWKQGRRDAQGELRLDADTEWDMEEAA